MTRSPSRFGESILRLFSTKIGIRLFLVLSLISIIPVSMSIVMALNASKLALKGQTLNTLEAISNSMQSRITAYLSNIEKELTVLVNDPFLIAQMELRSFRRAGDLDWEAASLNKYLMDNRNLLIPEAYQLAIADTTGMVLTSSNPTHIGIRIASDKTLEFAKSQIHLGDVFLYNDAVPDAGPHQATDEIPIWNLYAPIWPKSGDGPATALLVVSIDPAILSALLLAMPESAAGQDSSNFVQHPHTHVVNGSGLIIACTLPGNDHLYSMVRDPDGITQRKPSDPVWSAGYFNHWGQEVIGKAGIIEELGWMVISEIPIEIAFAPYRRLQRLSITGFMFTLLSVLGIATYFTNRIVKPLYRITLAHRALGEGDPDRAIIPPGDIPQDEIGDLMTSHNEMLTDLRKRSGQLQTALDSGHELLALLKRPTREQDFLSPSLESLCGILEAQAALVILGKDTAIGPSQSYFCATDNFQESMVTGLISELAETLSAAAPSELVRIHDLPASILNDPDRNGLAVIHSFLGVPIISRSHRYGHIFLLEKSHQQAFDVHDEQRAIGYASSIALILDNMNLVDKLQDSESRYRTLYDNTPLMVFRSTVDGQLLECNPRFYELLGYKSFAELASINLAKIYYNPADRDRLLRQLREEGQLDNYEIALRDKQGNRRYFLNNLRISSPADSDDSVIDGILLDITAQRKAEEEKQALQAQLMEKHQTETISTMAAGLAHEFNNLLMGMMSYAELGRMSPETSPELTEYFSNIISQSKRGAALISQILAYSRQAIITTTPTQLEELIEPAVNILRGRGGGIEFLHKVEHDLPPILADRTQLQVTITNLAMNGQEAMPEGGTLTFNVSRRKVGKADIPATFDATPGEFICLDIIDTGVGIADEMTEQVMTPFFTTKPPGQGPGLGLSQAYGVVRQHGGFLTISSVVGKGTTVRLAIPVAPQPVATDDGMGGPQAERDQTGDLQGGSECILLVEDSDVVRKAAKELLSNLGYEVLVADSAEEGIQLFQRDMEKIKLVLSDLIMPGASGREMCERIRMISPETPLILISGYADTPEIATFLKDGIVDGLLNKPFNIREMDQLLRSLLD